MYIVVRALCSIFTCFISPLSHVILLHNYVRTSWTRLYLCDFMFVCAPFCWMVWDKWRSIFFYFVCQPARDNGEQATWWCQHECILKSMQTMIGTLVQKVSDTENKYEELRGNEWCILSVRGRSRHTGERGKTCCRKVSVSRKELILGETPEEQTEGETSKPPDSRKLYRDLGSGPYCLNSGERNWDRAARKNDACLLNVQKLITTATATLVNMSDRLHQVIMVHACACKEQPNPSCFTDVSIKWWCYCSVIAPCLCITQQELSIRRWYQLQHALPKNMASLCSNENIPITDKPFGDDANKAIKTAREN